MHKNPPLISLSLATEEKYVQNFFINHVLVTKSSWIAPRRTFSMSSCNEVAKTEHSFLMRLVACQNNFCSFMCHTARAIFQKLVCSFSFLLLLPGNSANGLLYYLQSLLGSFLNMNSMLCSYLDCNLHAYSFSNWLHYFTLCCTEFYEPLIHPKANMLVL